LAICFIFCFTPFISLGLSELSISGELPPLCECGGVIKDDGVFFGEPIPNDVRKLSEQEALKCDVMMICGTSAVVQPFATLPDLAKYGSNRSVFGIMFAGEILKRVIIIEINAEPTPLTNGISDYLIQGKTGEVLPQIVEALKKI
jgi:NAD-dependent deacetylase